MTDDLPSVHDLVLLPIGSSAAQSQPTGQEARDYSRRASKIWLPRGKKSASTSEAKVRRAAQAAQQIDLEDAVEAAGGRRGHIGKETP